MARICLVVGFVAAALGLLVGGCVERELTVKTVPTGAVVTLNDEEIGPAPATTSFEWYGDYRVRVSKPGYATLVTHKAMERPLHDKFPFDFFAQVLWPATIKDKYEWTFELTPYEPPVREQLLSAATALKVETLVEVNQPPAKLMGKRGLKRAKVMDANRPAAIKDANSVK